MTRCHFINLKMHFIITKQKKKVIMIIIKIGMQHCYIFANIRFSHSLATNF